MGGQADAADSILPVLESKSSALEGTIGIVNYKLDSASDLRRSYALSLLTKIRRPGFYSRSSNPKPFWVDFDHTQQIQKAERPLIAP